MSWTKVEPWAGTKHIGCLNCSTAGYDVAPLDLWIAVGFGSAYVEKDGEIVYDELTAERAYEAMWRTKRGCVLIYDLDPDQGFWTVARAEEEAAKDPDHDWRIVKNGPLHGETYQRHATGQWVLIESNMGFA